MSERRIVSRKVSKKKKVLVRVTGVVGTFLIFMNVNAMPMATVSGDVVNVRTGASMDAEVVAQVQKGQELEVVGMQDGWYEIKSQDLRFTREGKHDKKTDCKSASKRFIMIKVSMLPDI